MQNCQVEKPIIKQKYTVSCAKKVRGEKTFCISLYMFSRIWKSIQDTKTKSYLYDQVMTWVDGAREKGKCFTA